ISRACSTRWMRLNALLARFPLCFPRRSAPRATIFDVRRAAFSPFRQAMSTSPPKTPSVGDDDPADERGTQLPAPDVISPPPAAPSTLAPETTKQDAPAAANGAGPTGRSRSRTARGFPRPTPQTLLGYVVLAPILALAAVLNTNKLSQNHYANVFYSAGVKSMLESFHNFFFASFDPGGLVTVDKPPFGLWVQALSAKIFGFSPLSLLLPEAILAVVGVGVLYLVVRRPFGQLAALVAALAL